MNLYKLLSFFGRIVSVFTVCLLSSSVFAQPVYCTSSLGGAAGPVRLDSAAISGTTLNNYTPANPYPYSTYPVSGSTTATLLQGGTYTLTVSTGTASPAGNIAMWLDFNQNGIFDSTEWILVGTDVSGAASMHFTVPPGTHTGLTGLRIRTRNTDEGLFSAADACTYDSTGETEDYYITIDTAYPCAGAPAAGAISGPDRQCAAAPFTLSLTGYTYAPGLSCSWLYAPSGSGAFTAIGGASGGSYACPGILTATDYKVIITCAASGFSDTPAVFTVGLNPPAMCYCDSSVLGGAYYYSHIDDVVITATTLNNFTPYTTLNYSAFPPAGSTTATLLQGNYYDIAITTTGYYYGYAADIGLWIDYNQDGIFADSEWTPAGVYVSGTSSAEFFVPVAARAGLTGMRIRTIAPAVFAETLGPADACTSYLTGETQDYLLTTDTNFQCTGTPAAGTISGMANVCAADSFTLSLSGYATAIGITIQWQSCPSGTGSFTDIAGAASPFYTASGIDSATDYRAVVTCGANSALMYTPTFTVNLNPFTSCYCSPATGITLVSGTGEDEIAAASIAATSFCDSAIYVPIGTGYVQVLPATPAQTAIINADSSYQVLVVTDSLHFHPLSVSMWIDYDHSGTYDSVEYTSLVRQSGGTFSAALSIPAYAMTGQTGMRILSSDNYAQVPDPCMNIYQGEEADFIITIDSAQQNTGPSGHTPFAIKAFPVPVTNILTIQIYGTPGTGGVLLLTDITGRTIEKVNVTAAKTEIDMTMLPPAMYLLRYEDSRNTKVIKVTKGG